MTDERLTNYDRIKSMSVEEMADFLTKIQFFSCVVCEKEKDETCTKENCANFHKQWLLQEVSDER